MREEKVIGPRSSSRNCRPAENFGEQQIALGQCSGNKDKTHQSTTKRGIFNTFSVFTCFLSGLEKDSDPEKMEKIQKMLEAEEQLHALDPPRSVSPLRRILKSVRKDAHDILF